MKKYKFFVVVKRLIDGRNCNHWIPSEVKCVLQEKYEGKCGYHVFTVVDEKDLFPIDLKKHPELINLEVIPVCHEIYLGHNIDPGWYYELKMI